MTSSTAGAELRKIRLRLGLTTREVATLSQRIAGKEANMEFGMSHARLVQIENNESTPSVYKLFTLSAIYGVPISRLLQIYVDLDSAGQYHLSFEYQQTRAIEAEAQGAHGAIEFPLQFREDASLQQTGVFSELVRLWGHVPLELLRRLNLRKHRYGIIGLSDYMMYPLLRPGSIVQIDETQRPGPPRRYANEYERPLYFVETRMRYLCCWCEIGDSRLVAVPHPLSSYRTYDFRYPEEAEVIGRVIAVVLRFAPPEA